MICLPHTSVVQVQYHNTQTLQRYVHTFSSVLGTVKLQDCSSVHARSFSAAGVMMDNAIAAKAARTVANGMRRPTLLSLYQPYISRLDSR
jgi:hypothetical protein